MANKARSTLARLRRSRKTVPVKTITMDLLGLGKDGNLYLWQEAADVLPITCFDLHDDGMIVGDHYVIEYHGAAITVHCSNGADGCVVVQFMCGGGYLRLPRCRVEAMLLGRVIPDPVMAAKVSKALQDALAALEARDTAPHRRRGCLLPRPKPAE